MNLQHIGQRTNPTVKPLAHMNQRNLRNWNITLGPVATVASLGVVLGSVACAFYLGFFSGQKVGIETALNNSLSSSIRLPVDTEEWESGTSGDVSSLGGGQDFSHKEIAATKGEPSTRAKPIPALESIKSTEVAPVGEMLPPVADENVLEDNIPAGTDSRQDTGSITEALTTKNGFVSPQKNGAEGEIIVDRGSPLKDSRVPSGNSSVGATLGALVKESRLEEPARAEKKVSERASVPSGVDRETVEVKRAEAVEKESRKEVPKVESFKVEGGPPAREKEKLGTSDASAPAKGWFAQIVAPNKRSEAESVAQKLRSSGFAVSIENAQVRGQQYYRVLVGPEDNRKQAELLISQLKREPYIKTEPFLRRIN